MSRIGPERQLSPAFEQLFGGIKRALSKAAKGAVSLAKKGIEDRSPRCVRLVTERTPRRGITRE